MERDLSGRHAVVTGASRGIGAPIALGLARQGAQVSISARDSAPLGRLESEASGGPGRIRGFAADMGNTSGVDDLLDWVEAEQGAVDILVNNVGQSPSRNLLRMTDEDWESLIRLNLLAAVHCTRRFLPHMRSQRWGRLVMIASAAAKYPDAGKAALVSVAKSLARHCGQYDALVTRCFRD